MKKFGSAITLLLLSLLLFFMTGCTGDKTSSTTNTKGDANSETITSEEQTDQSGIATDASPADKANSFTLEPNVTEEQKAIMGNLTGTWESQVTLADGSVTVVRVKIDNISGFTFTTGTINPDGNGTYYSRVGSYEVEGDRLIFSATTGGESNDGSSYQLRQDPLVFQYTFVENEEMTQLTLTPADENANLLTGEAPVELTRT